MTLTVETGFKYFIIKWLFNITNNYYITPATEASSMNITYNGGQGFKMISGYTGATNYTPSAPILQQTMTDKSAGVAKRGLRLSVDETTGTLNADIPTSTELLSRMNTSHFNINVTSNLLNINTGLAELKGPTGKGWTDASYNSTTGIVTFASNDALGFVTGNLKGTNGTNGTNGKGWTGGTYAAGTGIVTFASDDAGYAFTTGDLRGGVGATGKCWTGGSYSATTGMVTFASTDALGFTTGDLRGAAGGIDTNATNISTGTLKVSCGETGVTALTADRLLIGGTTAISQSAGLTWTAGTNTLTATNITGSGTALTALNASNISAGTLNNARLPLNYGTQIGIGIAPATGKDLHIYNATSANLLIETATNGNASIEFRRGTELDAYNDFRFLSESGYLKLQLNKSLLSFTDTNAQLLWCNDIQTINYKDFYNVGNMNLSTGTTPTTYKLNVEGTVKITGLLSTDTHIYSSGIMSSVENNTKKQTITYTTPAGSWDILEMAHNPNNSLRFKQNFTSTNNYSYNIIQKNNAVDYPAITFLNGQVAIGTLKNPSYALDVAGDINITGDIRKSSALYKPAGAVLADTTTDLATRAILSVGKGGTGASSFTATGLIVANSTGSLQTYTGLTYTTANSILSTTNLAVATNANITGNVGIGTLASAGGTKLNILGDVNIVGKTTQTGGVLSLIPTVPTATAPATLTFTPTPTSTFTPSSGLIKCAILTYQGVGTSTSYTATFPAGGLLCDVLIVGGGGSGGRDIGAGGGGGAVLYAQNVRIQEGNYTFVVGRGAIFGSGEARGQSSTAFDATILGGGSAGDVNWNSATYVNDGGSGAGGKGVSDAWSNRGGRPIVGGSVKGSLLNEGQLKEGSVGGYGISQNNNQVVSAGGGGANVVGGNGQTSTGTGGSAVSSSGGAGVSNNILDATYFWGGGGGGGSYQYTTPANGGAGGGGTGNNNNGAGITATGSNGASSFFAVGTIGNGINGTGGSGGGAGYQSFTAGSGGAGVIIIRYSNPANATQTIDFSKSTSTSTLDVKEGIIGGEYVISTTQFSKTRKRIRLDGNGDTFIGQEAMVVKFSPNDIFIKNNVGINIDPSSTYRLNVNGDLNVNGTIWQNGFSVNAGFQQYRTFNFTYTGDTNFLLTTRARYCNIVCWVSSGSGMIVSNGANMTVGEFRGSLGFSMTQSNATSYFFYWTMQGNNSAPFKAWFGNGNNTTFTFLEMWYN